MNHVFFLKSALYNLPGIDLFYVSSFNLAENVVVHLAETR